MERQSQHGWSHVDSLDGNLHSRRLRWGQTAKVLRCLSASFSRLRSCSVCRWKDTLSSVCHELWSTHGTTVCGRGRQRFHQHQPSRVAGSCWLVLLYLTLEISQGFGFFQITTEVVSTSLTLMLSPADYCWTLHRLKREFVSRTKGTRLQCRNSVCIAALHLPLLLNKVEKTHPKPLKFFYILNNKYL